MGFEEGQLSRFLSGRKEVGRTIGIAALLAFSISTASGLLVGDTFISRKALWIVSAIFAVVGCWAIIKGAFANLRFYRKIDAVVFIDKNAHKVIPVKGYDFSEKLNRVMNAIKAENSAIYAEWEREPLSKGKVPASPSAGEQKERRSEYIAITRVRSSEAEVKSTSEAFLEEAALYVVLESLSTHLSSHFTNEHGNPQIKEFSRQDFPEFLLSNRILNLLSTPIEERPIFLKAFPDPQKRPDGEIFTLWGSDGAVFSRFDMVLPVGSVLSSRGRNGLSIKTRRLEINLDVQIGGSSASHSASFSKNYVGVQYGDLHSRKVKLEFYGRISPMFFFSSKGWELYDWMDSFDKRLKSSFDFKFFLQSINWFEVIEPLLFALRQGGRQPKAAQPDSSKNDETSKLN
jgi:hypothetical protein